MYVFPLSTHLPTHQSSQHCLPSTFCHLELIAVFFFLHLLPLTCIFLFLILYFFSFYILIWICSLHLNLLLFFKLNNRHNVGQQRFKLLNNRHNFYILSAVTSLPSCIKGAAFDKQMRRSCYGRGGQERPSIDLDYASWKYINCSKTNAAYNESLITMTSRATQHAGNIIDSQSATTLSIHNEMLFFSGALGALAAEGGSTLIVSSGRMMLLPREDVLLLSSESFSLRTSTLKKMRKKIHSAFVLFFLFLFNYFFINLSSWHAPSFILLSPLTLCTPNRQINRRRQQHLRLHCWYVQS